MSESTETLEETNIPAGVMAVYAGTLTITANVLDVQIPGKYGVALDVALTTTGSGIGQASEVSWRITRPIIMIM